MQSALSIFDRAEHISSNRTVVSIRRLLCPVRQVQSGCEGWRTTSGGSLAAGEEGQTKSSRRRVADGWQQAKSGWRRTAGEERHVEGSRRTAADGGGGGYCGERLQGSRGKGCSVRTAGVCLSRGCSVTPREFAGRTPFPDRDRRSPPWSCRPPSAAPAACCQGHVAGKAKNMYLCRL